MVCSNFTGLLVQWCLCCIVSGTASIISLYPGALVYVVLQAIPGGCIFSATVGCMAQLCDMLACNTVLVC